MTFCLYAAVVLKLWAGAVQGTWRGNPGENKKQFKNPFASIKNHKKVILLMDPTHPSANPPYYRAPSNTINNK